MAKRRGSNFDVLASMPWPIGIVLGVIAFVGVQYGIGWLWGSSDDLFLLGIAKAAKAGMYTFIAWFMLIACCMAASLSFLKRGSRRQLLESQTGIESLRNMDWRSFESLVGEAFRHQGYSVEETGQGGADGGKDLVLRKDGLKIIVQCKQWRSQRVPVHVVREMFGVLVHEGASAVKIVTLCGYTPDAGAFAYGKPIELIDGATLLSTVKSIQMRKEPEGTLDNPLLFAGSAAVCILVALALPTQQPQPLLVTRSPTPPVSQPPVVAAPAAPTAKPSSTPTIAMKATAQPTHKIYRADAPMSDEELKDWEKRNREAMKILEKTTPEVESLPTR
ncbi:restriction endonuclease [Dyella sp. C11]|uniref:restriction endonuclease n=1 Tax=Dyella sp. C11 TaxID=2126991 RepID=UPI000D65A45F|nr:restriction endonuclease [Dyella sp. C11]